MNENPTIPPPPATVAPPPPPPPLPSIPPYAKSPGAAGVLSLFPGLGHVYLGLYQRGIVYFGIWVLIIAITNHHGGSTPIGILIPFWMLFVLIDAVRQARAINATGQPEASPILRDAALKSDGGLTLGILLILLGVFFLIERFVTIDLTWLFDWWPLILIAIGGWQVYLYLDNKKKAQLAAEAAADRSHAGSEL